jgi:3-ketosteroid 9alpha-monooxygenase subunit B
MEELAPAKEERIRIKPFDVTVSRIVQETPDTVTLYLSGDEPFRYKAGQFLTIDPHQFPQLKGLCAYFEQVKGRKEPPRAYSMASAPSEPELGVTVKEELYTAPAQTPYPPLLSPFLCYGVPPGLKMRVIGFTGPYVLDADMEQKTDHLLHVCAGSGIVPNFSILKQALHDDLKLRQTLVYANKTYGDIIFRADLEALAKRYPDRFKVIHTLTREPEVSHYGPHYRKGRIGRDLLEELLGDRQSSQVFTCGPGITPFEARAARKAGTTPTPRFLETMLAELKALEVPKDNINYESYG